ncbi:serine hydrolase [candidate division KSB1 bacterium]|nr:serine hydrolase [candidate division KSB1 bacterium]
MAVGLQPQGGVHRAGPAGDADANGGGALADHIQPLRGGAGQIQNAPYTDVSIKFVGGGVISTVEDLVRIFTALDNGTLIKPETVQTMYTTPRPGTQNGMGLGWSSSIDDKERLRVSHSGGATGFRSMLINYPAQELVVSTITNCDFYSPGSLAQQIADIYLAAIDAGKN